jgi:hypothetical protein
MRATLLFCAPLLATTWVTAAYADAPALLSDATLNVLSRNFFLNNDTRTGHNGDSYNREWAQGFIGRFESGYTPGVLGVGVDVHGFVGLRLDSGGGRAGTGLLPVGDSGKAAGEYSSAGGALKLKLGDTRLKLGEMEVETPVFDTADKRLQPEYATGALLQGKAGEALSWTAGRFNAFKNQDESSSASDFDGYGASTRHESISLLGVQSDTAAALSGALYMGELSDTWRQYYANLHLNQPLSAGTRLAWDANLYRTLGTGAEKAGAINTTAASLLAKLSVDEQAFSLGYQKISGDTPFDFVGGDSIYLANSIKYADFNGANEQSWQVRYDLDLSQLLTPGLTFMTRYVRGSNIDGTHAPQGGAYNPYDDALGSYVPNQGDGGKHWERDIEAKYKVQSGAAKDLAMSLSYVTHRGNDAQAGRDIDRLYVVVEYPLDVLGGR